MGGSTNPMAQLTLSSPTQSLISYVIYASIKHQEKNAYIGKISLINCLVRSVREARVKFKDYDMGNHVVLIRHRRYAYIQSDLWSLLWHQDSLASVRRVVAMPIFQSTK